MEKFLSLLNDPVPGFVCRAAGKQVPVPPPFRVQVSHQLGAAANAASLSKLSSIGAETLRPFYSLYDGAALFQALQLTNHIYPAIQFYNILEFDSKTKEMRESTEAMGLKEDDLYDFQKEGVVFGEVCFSGNYFVLNKGAVYYSDHDGGDDTPFATSFSQFLDRIAENPAKFLYEAGCYTRYSDGTTRNQWIPEAYLPNLTSG